jgi:hypothetical protein
MNLDMSFDMDLDADEMMGEVDVPTPDLELVQKDAMGFAAMVASISPWSTPFMSTGTATMATTTISTGVLGGLTLRTASPYTGSALPMSWIQQPTEARGFFAKVKTSAAEKAARIQRVLQTYRGV